MTFRRIFVYLSIILLGVVLGANVYNSVVDAPNWGASIPDSIAATKAYFSVANPGTFYRVISPASQVAALLSLIAIWPAGKRVRILAAVAVLLAVSGDVMTFAYFYPRNGIMFGRDLHSIDEIRNAWSSWSQMNWVRSAICVLALISQLSVLSGLEAYFACRSQKTPETN